MTGAPPKPSDCQKPLPGAPVIGFSDLFGARLPNAHNRIVTGSSDDMMWPTPQPVFDALNAEFHFTLDPCCVPATAKCAKYYTPNEDGLKQDWSGDRVFMNPPYGRWLKPWMRKAYTESQRGALVVCLVPARVDTAWWHDYASKGEVRFPRGRIRNRNGQSWPFPAAIVIFRPGATSAPNDQRERRETAATDVRIQSERNGCLPFARRFGSAMSGLTQSW